jgi:hypothetical protein
VSYFVLTGLYLALGSRAWAVRLEGRRLTVAAATVVAVAALVRLAPDLPALLRALLPVGYAACVLVLGGITHTDRVLLRVFTERGQAGPQPGSPR